MLVQPLNQDVSILLAVFVSYQLTNQVFPNGWKRFPLPCSQPFAVEDSVKVIGWRLGQRCAPTAGLLLSFHPALRTNRHSTDSSFLASGDMKTL